MHTREFTMPFATLPTTTTTTTTQGTITIEKELETKGIVGNTWLQLTPTIVATTTTTTSTSTTGTSTFATKTTDAIEFPRPHPRPAKRNFNLNSRKSTTTAAVATNTSETKPCAIRRPRERRKTCTELLCELIRLKTQQKYLECNQVKLKLDNFQDFNATGVTSSSSSALSKKTIKTTSPTSLSPSTSSSLSLSLEKTLNAPTTTTTTTRTSTVQHINDIEQLKIELDSKFKISREIAQQEVFELRSLVHALRDDVTQEERLHLYTLPAIRERIIGINKHLEYLCAKSACQLEKLQIEYLTQENDIKMRLK